MSKYYVCLELGGTNLRYGIVAQDYSVVEFSKIETSRLSDAPCKIIFLTDLLMPLIQKVGRERVIAVSMALSSLMDRDRKVVFSSPMVKGFNNLNIVSDMEKALGLPVIIEKDVNILLLYEISRLKECTKGIITGVFIGTGLGNAMCIDGRVYNGSTGSACELGHIPVPGLEQSCGCGKKGCIELLTCGKALAQLAENRYSCHVTDIFRLYGDKADVRRIVEYSAIAIATEVTILDPRYVILGGGVVEMPGFPLDYLVTCIKENLRIPNPRESFSIRLASGDQEAGVVGAAIHAHHMFNTA